MAGTAGTVFLDRDGVINDRPPDGDYVRGWEAFRFRPGAVRALARLRGAGLRLVVVTNQRGVARGLMSHADVQDIHRRMRARLAAAGADVDAVYYCPHGEGACGCRKPRPGMLIRAAHDFPDIDLGSASVVGDSLSDLLAGRAVGARTILIAERPPAEAAAVATACAPSLLAAVDLLLD